MDQAGVQIDEGGTSRLRILVVDANGQTRDMGSGSQVVWSVHNPEIASVQAGLVKGLRPGTTRVTATVSGRQSAHADVHVLSVPGSVDVVFGDRQAGIVGQSLSTPIRLRVLDRRGQPMRDVQLQFTPVQSSGSVTPSVATLSADGTAEMLWTLGTRAGPQAVDVRIAGRESVAGVLSAEAAPGPVARVQVTPGNALTNPGGRVRYSAAALDEYGNIVKDAPLQWAVVDSDVASISEDGTAHALIAGETQVEAIYVPLTTAGDAAQAPQQNRGQGWLRSQKGTGYPTQVTDLRSPSQSTSTVTLSFTQVGDGAGGPADYQVRYAATPIGQDFATATVAGQGSCRSPVDGQTIGATLTCVVEGLQGGRSYDFQVVAFRGTLGVDAVMGPESNVVTAMTSAAASPAAVEVIGGGSQSAAPGSQLPAPIAVRVKDAAGQPMPNVNVNWAVYSGGGSLSAPATLTNALGVTEVYWTLGSQTGTQEVRAAVAAISASVTATAASATKPATVTTLNVDSAKADRIFIRFTEVDDGTGKPADYSIRYHVTPMGWNWGTSTEVSLGTCASVKGISIGNVRRCDVRGLQSGVKYDIRLVSHRTGGSGEMVFGDLSNVATGTTLAAGGGTLAISPRDLSLQAIGAQQQLTATARDASGATLSNPGLTWTSSNTSVATIDSNGMLTAKGVGTVLITAAAACCTSDQITITVQQSVASVSVDPQSASLAPGQNLKLNATVKDANGYSISGSSVTWQSTNTSVATVLTDGTVRAESTGAASVVASSGGRSATTAVNVSTTSSSPSGWANEPAGGLVTVDIPSFSNLSLPNQLAGNWQYSSNYSSNVAVSSGALRWNYRQGFQGGASPGRAVINDINDRQFGNSYYVALRVRFSNPWTRHPAADKIIYFGEMTLRDSNPGVQAGQAYCGRVENGYLGCTIQASQGGPEVCPVPYDSARNFPCSEPWLAKTRIDDGAWHLIEIVATGSTNGLANGGLRVYVDGVMQWNATNVQWTPLAATRFYGVNLDPVWGGGTDVYKPQNEWMEIGALRVSGR